VYTRSASEKQSNDFYLHNNHVKKKGTVVKRVETGTIFLILPQRNITFGPVTGPLLAILSGPPSPFLPPRCYPSSEQLARRQLRGKPISALAATGQPIRTPGSYGAANQNAWQLWGSQSERAI